ncbi:hypothetical protein Ais01nite_07810 [Asanoa ishikariensis]|uniref:Allophanate hydrolase n=1 Tax=Asanoa ishikariensis TaxID=137265 RepID=A0A1H3TBX7_9ACTN|nr:allophanate hydrolase [Asanoa ishikariensis]GIF62746.1 hypothetical protein Ais01nite_07810 [Asanoa ishikariensis]SDZ47447.1 allophanate hydrolase [Asanoa ishikariensis]
MPRRPVPDLSVTALRAAYDTGALQPADVVEEVLGRIADDHSWITLVPADDLRARAAEVAARGDRPKLYGIPFAVKDNIDVAGLPTTAGCPDFAYRPDRTAEVVTRLLEAGAMLVGKTNLDQFATGLTGTRSPYGACSSVFGSGLVSGGSSSGSALAVATRTVSFALGTDTAGSGRVPAALNGIVGLKPTRGLLSAAGVVPACRSLDCVSVFAGDVAGAAAVFEVALARSTADPWSRTVALTRRAPGTLRLGVPDAPLDADPGQADAFARGRQRATALAARTRTVDVRPFLAAGDLLYEGPWVAERLVAVGDFLDAKPDSVLPVTRTVLETGRRHSAVDAFRAQHRLRELAAVVDRGWRDIDLLVLPTVGTTVTHAEVAADPIGRNAALGRYTHFANLLDLAVVAVPNGFTTDGRPASLSLIGPAGTDLTLLRFAAALA